MSLVAVKGKLRWWFGHPNVIRTRSPRIVCGLSEVEAPSSRGATCIKIEVGQNFLTRSFGRLGQLARCVSADVCGLEGSLRLPFWL